MGFLPVVGDGQKLTQIYQSPEFHQNPPIKFWVIRRTDTYHGEVEVTDQFPDLWSHAGKRYKLVCRYVIQRQYKTLIYTPLLFSRKKRRMCQLITDWPYNNSEEPARR